MSNVMPGMCADNVECGETNQINQNNDEQGVRVQQHESAVQTDSIPVSSADDNDDVKNDVRGSNDDNERVMRCNIYEGRCSVHDCVTKQIKVTSKQWKWRENMKSFGYVKSKQTKFICMARIEGSTAPDISTSVGPASKPAQRGSQGVEVGRLSDVNTDTRGLNSGAIQIRESSSGPAEQGLDDMTGCI